MKSACKGARFLARRISCSHLDFVGKYCLSVAVVSFPFHLSVKLLQSSYALKVGRLVAVRVSATPCTLQVSGFALYLCDRKIILCL